MPSVELTNQSILPMARSFALVFLWSGVRDQRRTGEREALPDGRQLKRFEGPRRPIPLEPEEIRRFQRLGEPERNPRGQAGGIGFQDFHRETVEGTSFALGHADGGAAGGYRLKVVNGTEIVPGKYVWGPGLNHQGLVVGPPDIKVRATGHERSGAARKRQVMVSLVKRHVGQRECARVVENDDIFILHVR